ncbi:MAG: glycosyltransferase family 2 protein [Thermostichales cyanobacterium SZTDM-1c_bins_54]
MAMLVVLLSGVMLVGIYLRLRQSLAAAPRLDPSLASSIPPETLTVIIPAYNEAANIQPCLRALLGSTPDPIQVIVVDDQSQDATPTLLQTLAQELQDPRLTLISGADRPPGWVGKTWACHQGSLRARTPYVLFMDCDVRLQPGSLGAMLAMAQGQPPGLVSFAPQVVCGCLAEWLVQPLMVAILAVGFDCAAVNDPRRNQAFAFGPLMLFHRQAYQAIGGHAAVADQVVEDVALARRIKQAGYSLQLARTGPLARLRMYLSGSQLWEGWTKNWFVGLHKRWDLAAGAVLGIVLVTVVPWLGLLLAGINRELEWWLGAGVGILMQVAIRWELQRSAGLAPRYLWLTWLGGLITASIILASIYKTWSGRGWTWRGRPLSPAGSGSATPAGSCEEYRASPPIPQSSATACRDHGGLSAEPHGNTDPAALDAVAQAGATTPKAQSHP